MGKQPAAHRWRQAVLSLFQLFRAQPQLASDRLHPLDAQGDDLGELHPQHLAPLPDHLPAAFGGKGLILELFIHAFGREVGDTGGPHQGGGHDDAGQLVHGKQALFHGGFGLHVAHQAVAVALDRADIRVGDALRRQQLLHMAAVLLGILLEVHIVQIANRRPMRGILAEMLRHNRHGAAYRQAVAEQMRLRDVPGQNLPGLLHRQHTVRSFIHSI